MSERSLQELRAYAGPCEVRAGDADFAAATAQLAIRHGATPSWDGLITSPDVDWYGVLIHGQKVCVRLPSGQTADATVVRYSAGTTTAHVKGTRPIPWETKARR